MPTNEEIDEVFSKLSHEYYRREPLLLNEIRIKSALDTKEMELLAAGTIVGGNAEIRSAKLRQATIELHNALEEARVALLNSETRIKMVTQEVETYRLQIWNTDNLLREKDIDREAKKNG
jgi:hypothetical protein